MILAAAPWVATAAMTAAWWARRGHKATPGLSKAEVAAPEHFEHAEPGRGRLARFPHHIPWIGWKDVLWRTYREVTHDRLTVVAGSVTFYTLLAIFPGLGVFVSLYGLIADVAAVQAQLVQLSTVFPAGVLELLGEQMMRLATQRSASLSVAFAFSLLISIWSANASMKSLFDGLNIAYDEDEKRNYFARSALTYGFTFALVAFLTVTAFILVGAPLALEAMGVWTGWFIPARWLVLFAFASGAFAIVYRYGPCRARAQWRWVILGGMAAAALWMSGSLAFSWYVNNIAQFDVTYGSLGAVVGFMLWIWFSVMVVLVGAELNAEIEHQTALDTTSGAPLPMGERGAAMADTVGLRFVGFRKGAGILWGDTRRQVGNLVRRPAKDQKPLPSSPDKSGPNGLG